MIEFIVTDNQKLGYKNYKVHKHLTTAQYNNWFHENIETSGLIVEFSEVPYVYVVKDARTKELKYTVHILL